MFSLNKKLELNLKACLESNPHNKYRVLIKYKRFKDNIVKKINSYKGEFINIVESCNLICARLNSFAIKRLIEYPEIEYICFDEYLFLCGMSVSTANKVNLYDKDRNKITGKNIGIAIIDSGVYPHSDLTTPSNRIALFKDLVNNLNYPYDDNGHGTCVAGIIAGNGTKSDFIYKGLAYESLLYCYKAFDKHGKGFISDVFYAIELVSTDCLNHNIKVLCLPFELLNYNKFIQDNFNTLVSLVNSKNIVCVIPSGSNRNLDGSITGLALNNNCITVSGYDSTSNISSYIYSSTGTMKKNSKPNLCAACVNINSLNSDVNYISEKDGHKLYPSKLETSYKTFTGTSLACAFIAGVCALIYEQNENLTPKDISSLLKVSCETLDLPRNQEGDGKVNLRLLLK